MSNLYGYGIVDKDGKPWCGEECVASEDFDLEEVVDCLNADKEIIELDENGKFVHPPNYNPPAPYRVVALYWDETNTVQTEEGYPQ